MTAAGPGKIGAQRSVTNVTATYFALLCCSWGHSFLLPFPTYLLRPPALSPLHLLPVHPFSCRFLPAGHTALYPLHHHHHGSGGPPPTHAPPPPKWRHVNFGSAQAAIAWRQGGQALPVHIYHTGQPTGGTGRFYFLFAGWGGTGCIFPHPSATTTWPTFSYYFTMVPGPAFCPFLILFFFFFFFFYF